MKKILFVSVIMFSLCFTQKVCAQIINQAAGNNIIGYSGDGGPATAAEINIAIDYYNEAFDTAGNMYIPDGGNSVVRKVNPAGIISTFAGIAGSGGYSGDGGAATAAEFDYLTCVATDYKGDVYISDLNNSTIRMVNTSGIISTVAGNFVDGAGYSGDGGPATAAEISNPYNIAVDSAGDIYIADQGNSVIRKVNTSGIITTVAGIPLTSGYTGDGAQATAAELGNLINVSLDKKGNIYIEDDIYYVCRMVNTSGVISTIAGTGVQGTGGDGGPATAAELSFPESIAIDRTGNIFISDAIVIREINTSGIINTVIGNRMVEGNSGNGGPAILAEFEVPDGIAFDKHGNLFIADGGNDNIRVVNNSLSYIGGTDYSDALTDCIYLDGYDPVFSNITMKLITNTDTLYSVTDSTGFYYFVVGAGNNYTVELDSAANPTYSVSCPASGIIDTSAPSINNNFALVCTGGGFDLAGNLNICIDTPITNSNTATIMACIYNNLCLPVNGTLNLIIDTNIQITSMVADSAATISGDTLKWNYSNISTAFPQNLCVSLTGIVKDSLAIISGDSNYVTLLVTPTSGDIVPSNNNITYWVKAYPANCVGLPYDPNNKSVYPVGNVSPSQRLDYTIEFQNTGNIPATNVVIYDTLSPYLDISTLAVVSSSFPVATQIINGNILQFTFADINLPDSSGNQNGSKGQIIYSIKPLSTVPNGTRINNKAGIYFDANPEIPTNITYNIIDTSSTVTSVKDLANPQHFVCFPNPFNNTTDVLFNTEGVHYLEVDDIAGRKLKWVEFSGTEFILSRVSLSDGIYFIKAFDNNLQYISTAKIVVIQ